MLQGFVRVFVVALPLVLLGRGTEGLEDDELVSEASAMADGMELGVTEQTDAVFQAGAVSESVGAGCTLYTIVADAGSRARGQAYVSCDERKSSLYVEVLLAPLHGGRVGWDHPGLD